MREHEWEPVPGLPERLPAGERILWQGAPNWRSLARRAFHVNKVAVYLAVLLAWNAWAAIDQGYTVHETLVLTVWLLPLPLLATGILLTLAYAYARSTLYTVTNRRVVIRSGVAMPITTNLPFKVIGDAAVRRYGGGVGDVSLAITGKDQVAYLNLWPNVRRWHFSRPQPMLRVVPDVEKATGVLGDALSAFHGVASADAAADRAGAARASVRVAPLDGTGLAPAGSR
ncbi:MAG: photosynthetic complex putative assembly protein PuhB [Pseudomonadota bacterium]